LAEEVSALPVDREAPDEEYSAKLDGCCLVQESDHDVSVVAASIRPEIDAFLYGRILFQALSALYLGRPLSMANLSADDPLCRVLAALRFTVIMRQSEMLLTIG
jgi:hypothetical protein